MNIELYEGQVCKVYIALNGDFEVYGGTTKSQFTVTRTGDDYLVTIPGQKHTSCYDPRFDIFARRATTGQEWLVLSGKINLKTRRSPDRADVISCVEYHIAKELVESGETVDGGKMIVGIKGDSAYDIARANGYEGTEAEYSEMVTKIPEYADTAVTAANDALSFKNAALTSEVNADNSAEAAKASEDNAAQSESDAKAHMNAAAEHADSASKSADAASTSEQNAAKSAQDALANKQDAEQAAQDAAQAQAGAEQAKTAADAAKTEAQTAEQNAKASANAAASDKTATVQAKEDAQAAQTKAEQEASKAEQNAALLGDAALKSADNTFTGLNTFNGEVAGVLPWDFFAYSWCKNKEELWAACPDIEQRSVFCADLSSMAQDGSVRLLPINVKKTILYFSGDILGDYVLGYGLKDIVIFAPNATKCGNIIAGEWQVKSRFMVYAPKCAFNYRSAMWGYIKTVIYITKMEQLMYDSLGNGYSYTESLIMPFNVVKKIKLEMHTGLWNVPYGFPHATLINFNKTKLNKASVMAILNDLKPYDAATMTTVPELSIGIDPALDGDEEINAALLLAQESVENGGKGWNVAVSGFNIIFDEAQPAIQDDPVIYAEKRADADGCYVDEKGERWSVRWGNVVIQNYQRNEELGYTEFSTLEDALSHWGLTEYKEQEELS